MSERTKPITQAKPATLYIKDLEQPAPALLLIPGVVTTLAIGEEAGKGKE